LTEALPVNDQPRSDATDEHSAAPSRGDGPPPAPAEVVPARAGRYELGEAVGRGGMGAVYRARDPELNRDLAVKVLLERHRGDDRLRRRFLEEAQIAGQLQHPGVAPVHEVGTLPDGRPFIAMKLVKGRTLAELLAERPTPAHDLPHFLAVFEQVCQTIAYAHNKGVVHRDLKPQNVMVGAFGEVQVMDWGLAKVLGDPASRECPRPEEGPAASLVETGTVRGAGEETQGALGTLAYMPPEQAAGLAGAVGPHSDVFGLGAVLCEVLTGKPPYAGVIAEEVRLRALRADLTSAFARLDRCGADPDLIGLARRCLAAEPSQRPRDGRAVAAAVATHLASVAERLRRSELDRAAAEARTAEERKRRRLTVALAAVVLLAVAAAAAGGLWVQHDRAEHDLREAGRLIEEDRRRDETERRVARAEDRAKAAWGEGRLAEAVPAAHQAASLAEDERVHPDVKDRVRLLVKEVNEEAAQAERDRRLLARLLDVRGPRDFRAFRPGPSGVAEPVAEPTTEEQFAEGFREWGLDVDNTPTEQAAVRVKGRPPAVQAEVAAALDGWADDRRRQQRPADARRLADLAGAIDPDPGRQELRAALADGRLEAERAAAGLSAALLPLGGPAGLTWVGGRRAALRRLAEKADPRTEPVLGVLLLARALRAGGDDDRAERLLGAAARVRAGGPALWDALGRLQSEQRPPRWAEAAACFQTVRALRPDLGVAFANALSESGRPAQAEEVLRELLRPQPDHPFLRLTLGIALTDQRRPAEAEAEFRAALRLKPDYYRAHNNLGVALFRQGRLREAEAEYREARRLNPDALETHINLGTTLSDLGRPEEAVAEYRAALRLRPDYPEVRIALANALLFKLGRPVEAEAEYREGLRLRPDAPLAHYGLGIALMDQDRYKDAEAEYRAELRLRPDLTQARHNLGAALMKQGRPREAEAAFREALRLRPDYPEAQLNLGTALAEQGRFAESLGPTRRGHELGSRQPGWPHPSAALLRQAERLAALEARLPALLRGDDQATPADLVGQAEICQAKRLHAAAARFAAAALATEPGLAQRLNDVRYNAARSAARAAAGQGEDAARLPAKAKAALRRQSLDWLRAELAGWAALAADEKSRPQLRQSLRQWRETPDLAGVRDPAALAQLPVAERAGWANFWADAADLLRRAEAGP
jgi:serine/threonine-protein kinase